MKTSLRIALTFAVTAIMAGGARHGLAQGKKVLMFTKSAAFEHSVVRRGPHGELGLAERTVVDLGKKHHFVVTASKDGSVITADNLKNYQALFFFTQGEIDTLGLDKNTPIGKEHRQAVLDFIANGGGFIGAHCGGADTWHRWEANGNKPFLRMVGGEFTSHGPQQVAQVTVVDTKFPAVRSWGKAFSLNDEWYAYRDFHANMHVLMMLETRGMRGQQYQRESYPITWCSQYGNGKVFYTGLGHREDVWENPKYQDMIATAIQWILGEIEADASPNLKALFGDEAAALKRLNPR